MRKAVIIDDHRIVRKGVADIIKEIDDIETIAEFSDGAVALDYLLSNDIDIAICDLSMPKLNGLSLLESTLEHKPDLNFLVFTMHNERQYVMSGLEKGAKGFILKDSEDEDLMQAIDQVANGQNYFDRQLTYIIASQLRAGQEETEEDNLTEREREILALIVAGLTTSEIADKLYLSSHTIDTHRRKLMKKLKARNTADLVRKYFENISTNAQHHI